MGGALRRLFNLYPGEERKAGLFAILAFLWSLGGYGFLTLSEGMFLEHVGAHSLPPVYLGISLGMCFLSTLLIFALRRFSLHILLLMVLLGAIGCNLLIYFLVASSDANLVWIIFKILGWIVPVATYICFWAFVDQYYDLQDAKRFFCLFNSITFFGDACAGGIISGGLERFGVNGLLLFFTLLMTCSIPFIFIISKKIKRVQEETFEDTSSSFNLSINAIVKKVAGSRFTWMLMALYFVMQLLAIATEYNTMDSFDRSFKLVHQESGLTEFLGTCGMWVSLGNMIFCLFFYSRIVKKIGVHNILLIAPSFFLFVFFAWFFSDLLAIAVLGFIAREGMVYSFDDNNLNLLISGVPTRIKNQVRVAIESFFEPIGMMACALILLFFQNESKQLGLALASLSLIVAFLLRGNYHKAIFQNLLANSIRFEKSAIDWIAGFSKKEKKEVEFLLLSKLRQQEEPTQLLAYEYLLKISNPRLLPRLLNQFSRLSINGKVHAIELLSNSLWAKESTVVEHLERWRRTLPHPSIKSSIHFYFARHSLLRPEKILCDLRHDHIGLRGAAILSLKTFSATPRHYLHEAREMLNRLLCSTEEREIGMGLRVLGWENNPENLDILFPFLDNSSSFIRRIAAKSIAQVAHPDWKIYAVQLTERLPATHDPETRLYFLEAIEKFADPSMINQLILSSVHFRPNERKRLEQLVIKISESCEEELLSLVQDETIHIRCRLLAGKILGKQSLKLLKQNLFPLIQEEIQRAFFYFYHAQTISDEYPDEDLSILVSVLLTGFESITDFIVQLLSVASSIEESEILSHTLKSKNRKIRAHALETLEKTCDPKIFASLHPLIDETKTEEKLRLFIKNGGEALPLIPLLDKLFASGSIADQIVSLIYKSRLNAPGWREALRQKLEEDKEIFHHFAFELIDSQI